MAIEITEYLYSYIFIYLYSFDISKIIITFVVLKFKSY